VDRHLPHDNAQNARFFNGVVNAAKMGILSAGQHLRHELDRMHLVTLADGRVAQRSAATPGQHHILRALDLPEPPKFLDFTLPAQA